MEKQPRNGKQTKQSEKNQEMKNKNEPAIRFLQNQKWQKATHTNNN